MIRFQLAPDEDLAYFRAAACGNGQEALKMERLAALPHLSDMEEFAAGNDGLAFPFFDEKAMKISGRAKDDYYLLLVPSRIGGWITFIMK